MLFLLKERRSFFLTSVRKYSTLAESMGAVLILYSALSFVDRPNTEVGAENEPSRMCSYIHEYYRTYVGILRMFLIGWKEVKLSHLIESHIMVLWSSWIDSHCLTVVDIFKSTKYHRQQNICLILFRPINRSLMTASYQVLAQKFPKFHLLFVVPPLLELILVGVHSLYFNNK